MKKKLKQLTTVIIAFLMTLNLLGGAGTVYAESGDKEVNEINSFLYLDENEEVQAKVLLMDGDTVLREDTDYTVSVTNCDEDDGCYKITVEGMGDYTGYTLGMHDSEIYTYYQTDEWNYIIDSENYVYVVAYTGEDTEIEVPETIIYNEEKLYVSWIKEGTFFNNTSITQIDLQQVPFSNGIIINCNNLKKLIIRDKSETYCMDLIKGGVSDEFTLSAWDSLVFVKEDDTGENEERISVQDYCESKGYQFEALEEDITPSEITDFFVCGGMNFSSFSEIIAGTTGTLYVGYRKDGEWCSEEKGVSDITCISSNEDVLTVDDAGNVTAASNVLRRTSVTITVTATVYGKEYHDQTNVTVCPKLAFQGYANRDARQNVYNGTTVTLPKLKLLELVDNTYTDEDGSNYIMLQESDIAGSFEVTYTSKNTSLATVDNTGSVEIASDATGDTEIVAVCKIGDAEYSASFTLRIQTRPEVSEPPFELPATEGEVLDIYSFNEELESQLDDFFAVYPQYKDKIAFHLLPSISEEGSYAASVEKALNATENKPDLIVWEPDSVRYAVEQDYVADLSEIGFDASWYKNAYPYTIVAGSKKDNLKAVTWLAMPGCFTYRADIAQEVLGTSDPEKVQEMVSDWDSFLATAEKMKQNGYKMVAGMDAMNLTHFFGKDEPWVEGNTINMNSCAVKYLEFSNNMYQNGYTNNHDMWSDEWFSDFDGNVFGFQGVNWFINFGMNATVHENDYKVCEGPDFFSWGGWYITATTNCDNKDLAKLLLYTTTCDSKYMKQNSINTQEFVNNSVVNEAVYKEGKVEQGKLQNNPYPVWMNVAKNIAPVQDFPDVVTLNELTNDVRVEMCSDNSPYSTVEEALKELEKRIKEKFPDMEIKYGKTVHHFSTEWTIDKAATCAAPGSKSHHCTDKGCTEVKDVTVIPATGKHTYGNGVITTLSTCVEKGKKTYTCTVCKHTKTEEIPATGTHTYGEWKETVAPTCNTNGKKERQCTTCSVVETEEIPATGFVKGGEFTKGDSTYTIKTVKGKKGTVVYEGTDKKAKKVKVPKTVKIEGKTYTVTEISAGAFKDDTKLKSVTIPEGITKIGKEAFSGCKNLTSITIKSTKLTSVGSDAIKGIHKKAIIKVPEKKYDKYKKLFKSKTGYKKTMTIKK